VEKKDSPVNPGNASPEDPAYPPLGYAWYVVGVLMVIYVLSFIDRQILSLLVGPIKNDLAISDWMMGLLMGPSFAIFYTLFGIPLGRMADSRSRRAIIAAGVAIWSAMTACCGLARNYTQLFMFRVGVGVGEAALSPAAYSLITDYFPRRWLSTAISVYGMGIYIGSGMAYLLGGLVIKFVSGSDGVDLPVFGTIRPWQVVFLIVGVPGLLFSLLMLTVREPYRRGLSGRRTGVAGSPSSIPIREVLKYIHSNKATFFCHNMSFALLAMAGYGGMSWIPEFFARTHGWERPDVGLWYGLVIMTFGSAGIVFGGHLADRLAARGHIDSKMRTGLVAALACMPFSIAYTLVPNGTLAMICLAPQAFAMAMPFGAAPAAMQEVMPPNMRGQAAALYLFVVNLIGIGLGAPSVAAFTDYVFQSEDMVRYSLLIVGTVSTLAAALLLWLGLAPFRRSMQHLETWEANNG
jgi:MFS family permease